MRRTVLGVLAATGLALTGAAHAADMPLKGPMIAPASWTGWYIGINGGGGWGSVSPSVTNVGPDSFFAAGNVSAVTANGSQHFHTSGALAGGQIGYLFQAGRAIMGFEVAADWTGFKGSASNGPTIYPVTSPSAFSWNLSGKSDWLVTVLGRFGLDMGSWYPYVTGGAAISHLTYSANFVDTYYPSNMTNTFSKDAVGWAIGAGAEARLNQRWMLRGEYLHIEFDHFSGLGPIACSAGVGLCATPANATTFSFNAKFREDLGRLALSYKF
jgi:outer membrane immunogenic protein